MGIRRSGALRRLGFIGMVATLALSTSGCLFYPYQHREAQSRPTERPWWCTSDVGSDLSQPDCASVSFDLDLALLFAHAHPTAADAVAAGATAEAYVAGVGARHTFGATPTFVPNAPNALLYDGTDPDAQIAGIEYDVTSGINPPAGFPGDNDVWADTGGGTWRLRVWNVRPFENQNNVFASSHPCLGASAATYDVTAACFTSTHPGPLQILVTNDDGYAAAGIDAVVQGLIGLPGVEVSVVAPATNQSGTSDRTTAGPPANLPAANVFTTSGYPAVAVTGFPADSVIYATQVLGLNPDLVVSGINFGQNIGPLASLSGTVGAARVAARAGIPAVATSQGFGSPTDYPSGVSATLAWVNRFRLGQDGPPAQAVASINIPTCTAGSIRGTRYVPTATATGGRSLVSSDCTSAVTNTVDDIDAFIYGFVAISDVRLN